MEEEMKRTFIDIIIIIILCGAFVGCWYFFGWGKQEPEIVIKRETKVEVKYVKEFPKDCDEFKKAFYDPWNIKGVVHEQWIDITCYNNYVWVKKSFEFNIKPKTYHHGIIPLLIGGMSYDNERKELSGGYGGALLYSHHWGRAGLAGGPGFVKFKKHYDFIGFFGGILQF